MTKSINLTDINIQCHPDTVHLILARALVANAEAVKAVAESVKGTNSYGIFIEGDTTNKYLDNDD